MLLNYEFFRSEYTLIAASVLFRKVRTRGGDVGEVSNPGKSNIYVHM